MLTDVQKRALEAIQALARRLPQEKGRALTGLIGELSACKALNLKWDPSSGYDAVDKNGKHVQIKTRRDSKGGEINKVGTVGGFTNFDFHYALYAELDAKFDLLSIYKIDMDVLPSLITRKDNALTVSAWRKNGKVVFPKQK